MKIYLVHLLFILIIFSCKSSKNVNPVNSQKSNIKDSLLYKTSFGKIYFSNDTTLKYYQYFQIKHPDSILFNSIWQDVKSVLDEQKKVNVQHFENALINTSWTDLYQFKGNFCLHAPSDWMVCVPLHFTDSTLAYLSSDPWLEITHKFKQHNPTSFSFETYNSSFERKKVIVKIIDSVKGIAIWEWKDSDNKLLRKEYKVLIKKVKLFPIIIQDCGDQKCEFGPVNFFDTPSFN